MVTLYGGNDGLNTVIPYADPAYHDARPGLSYSADQVLQLDDATGLNPALKGLHKLYNDKKLAIVRGVGYPKPDRSHFRSMDIWQTAQPDRPGTTGWLGRWLDRVGGDPRLAVSFEPVLPPLLAGETQRRARRCRSPGSKPAPRGAEAKTVHRAGQAVDRRAAAAGPGGRLLRRPGQGRRHDHRREGRRRRPTRRPTTTPEATGTGGNRTALAAQLDLVAQCVEAGVSTRVFSVSLGGFDSHADEKAAAGAAAGRAGQGGVGLRQPDVQTERGPQGHRGVYSEFGRRVKANASDGTDHGTASNVFLLGAEVDGGCAARSPA